MERNLEPGRSRATHGGGVLARSPGASAVRQAASSARENDAQLPRSCWWIYTTACADGKGSACGRLQFSSCARASVISAAAPATPVYSASCVWTRATGDTRHSESPRTATASAIVRVRAIRWLAVARLCTTAVSSATAAAIHSNSELSVEGKATSARVEDPGPPG